MHGQNFRRKILKGSLGAALTGIGLSAQSAGEPTGKESNSKENAGKDYPNKPIKLIVPLAAGSAVDNLSLIHISEPTRPY